MSQVHHCHLWQVLAEKKKKLAVCNTGVPPKGVGRQILIQRVFKRNLVLPLIAFQNLPRSYSHLVWMQL